MIGEIFLETAEIMAIVAVLMVAIEWLEIKFRSRLERWLVKSVKTQIIGASLLGAVPGCFDAFFVVSLYTHRLVGFGALVAVMLSTAGDEAFAMLAMIPKEVLAVFAVCAALGIVGGFIAEWLARKLKIEPAHPCVIKMHEGESGRNLELTHFLKEHVWEHIVKKHLPRLFLWVFFTMVAVHLLMGRVDLAAILPQNKLLLILLAAVIGIIPESGPHLVFLTLYAEGLIPFSVLLVSTLSQDGHGLLPLLSHSIRDAVRVQIFTTLFSLAVGLALFLIGF